MLEALKEDFLAKEKNEVPVGAIAVKNNSIVSRSHNLVETLKDITSHAEINILKDLSLKYNIKYFIDIDLYITLEPCIMCFAAISNAKIRNVYFGAFDEKTGAISASYNLMHHSAIHHKSNYYGGIKECECANILKEFFIQKRI
jgi:tRNA(adenine34) deaminase